MAGLTKEQRAERTAAKAAEAEAAKRAAEEAAKAAEAEAAKRAAEEAAKAAEAEAAKRAAEEAAKAAEDGSEDDGLIAVMKDGEPLRVHPSCVGAHVRAGWKPLG